MAYEETLTCPFCHGRAHMSRTELSSLLDSGNLRTQIEEELAGLRRTQIAPENVNLNRFERDVHSWNPQLPIWRRSPKE